MKKSIFILVVMVLCQLSQATEVRAITNFNVNKYTGTWYEIARLDNQFQAKCIAPITANYSLDTDDSSKLIVTNKCNTASNKIDEVTGMATFTESATIGKLKVNFLPKFIRWLPVGNGDYWILNVDYDKLAVVGSPDHKYLWILARNANITESNLSDAIDIARQNGFDITALIFNYPEQKQNLSKN